MRFGVPHGRSEHSAGEEEDPPALAGNQTPVVEHEVSQFTAEQLSSSLEGFHSMEIHSSQIIYFKIKIPVTNIFY
jgi:hypothetical protein